MTTVDDFCAQVLRTNPFWVNRVLQPSTANVDANTIHQAEYEELVKLAEMSQNQWLGIGAVLWGEAGVGKSHLLSRLARWAEVHRQACFVYFHNLQAREDSLPRYVLKCVVSTLTLGRTEGFHGTPLYYLVNQVLKGIFRRFTGPPLPWDQAEYGYGRWVEHLLAEDPTRAALIDRTIYQVVLRFFRSAYQAHHTGDREDVARQAVQWLSGEPLDSEDAQALGLRLEDLGRPAVLRDEQHIKQVLIALIQLAAYRLQPVLLCFDQVDNLEADQVAALSRFLQALLDSAPNLLVVTTGVQSALMKFRELGAIQDSSWDRLAQFRISLQRITARESSEIVQARLQRFLEPYLELAPVKDRVQQDCLFPLGDQWFQEYFQGKYDVRPRDVISWAREGWRREQEALQQTGGPAWLDNWGKPRPGGKLPRPGRAESVEDLIDRRVDQKIAEQIALRESDPQTLPPDAANLSGLMGALLRQCLGADRPGLSAVDFFPSPKVGPKPVFDLVVRRPGGPEGREVRTGILCLVTNSASVMSFALRRLVLDLAPPEHVLLVTDSRRPLRTGVKGLDYLDRLRRNFGQKFRHVDLSLADYATLDALQAVVGMARSGDLEIEAAAGNPQRVSEEEVICSHRRRGRYWAHRPLRDVFAFGEPPATGMDGDQREA